MHWQGAPLVVASPEADRKNFRNPSEVAIVDDVIYTLGPFRLDTRDNLLLRGSEPLALGRRALALLRALVERPGALVSKDALIEAA